MIIKELRIKRGFSVTELSDNICTNKHIYHIEKDKRLPSIEIVYKLSRKLRVDLFSYLPFVQFDRPNKSKENFDLLEACRANHNYDELEKNFEVVDKCESSTCKAYLIFYKSLIDFYRDNKVSCTIDKINKEIPDIDTISLNQNKIKNTDNPTRMIISLLSIIYLEIGEYEKAASLRLLLDEITINEVLEQFSYRANISIMLDSISFYIKTSNYNKALELGLGLYEKMNTTYIRYKIQDLCLMLSQIYKEFGNLQLSRKYAIHSCIEATIYKDKYILELANLLK